MKPPRWSVTLLLALLTALALAIRLWRLDFQSLWWDEGVSIYLAGAGIGAMTVTKDFAIDLHPPGYHLLLGAWREVFGTSVFTLRLLSVFVGTLTVPLTALVARRIAATEWRDLVSLIAALLATTSPIDGFYSQETRMYALLPLLGLLALLATLRVAESGRRSDWVFWVLANLLGWYVYYYLIFWTLALAIGLIGRRQGRAGLVAGAGLVLLYLPWVFLLWRSLGSSWSVAVPVETEVHYTAARYLLEVGRTLTLGFTPPPWANALLAIWGLLALLGAARLAGRNARTLAIVALAAILPVAGAGAILLLRPFFYPRFIVFVASCLWLLVAIGAGEAIPFGRSLGRRRIGALVAAGLILPILAGSGWTWIQERTLRTALSTDDYRVAFQTIAALARPGDIVLGDYPWQAGYVDAYLGSAGVRGKFLRPKVDPAAVAQLAASVSRVWVYAYGPGGRFERNDFESILASRLPTLAIDQSGDARVRLFATTGEQSDPGSIEATEPTFGGVIGLEASAVTAPPVVRPGAVVPLLLRWRALAVPPESYTVFAHLLGPDRKVYGQLDSPPLAGAFPTDQWVGGTLCIDRFALTLAPDAPAGRYEVEIGLYRPADGQRLVVGPTPQPDNRIVIAEFTVVK